MNRKVVLNDDVLFLILQELSSISETNTDLLAVMQTCRTFHRLGMKVFLCRKVILRTEETVASFCDALSADNYSRAPMLRDLHWECGAISQPTSKALCSLLPHATLLQDVYVEDLDLLLDCVPELNHVLANMECLRRLSVVLLAPTTAILAFFSTFRSQLTDLDIKFHAISAEDPSEVVWDVDLLRQLHPFALTLDHLSVDHLSMRSCASIVFPNVTVLEMDAVFLPSVDILARAFPRLRELEVFGAWWNEDASRSDVEAAVARRGAHLATQERHKSWCELRKVSGGLVDILALGLTCPVSALALEVSESTFDRRSVGEMLRRLLGDTPKLRDLQLATTVDIFELRRTQNMDGNGLWGLMDIDATLEVQYIYINYAVQSLYRIFVSCMFPSRGSLHLCESSCSCHWTWISTFSERIC